MKPLRRWSTRLPWLVLALVLGVFGAWYFWESGVLKPPQGAADEITGIWWLSAVLLVLGFLFLIGDLGVVVIEGRGVDALRSALESTQSGNLPILDIRDCTASRRLNDMRSEEPRILHGSALPATWISTAIRRTSLELAPLGATTRALAAVLLLLAVLGTFAGMRKAVPELVSSLPVRTGVASEPDLPSLRNALEAVGNSFGANFLALLGSVVLGVGAFGASRARAGILSDIASVLDKRISNLPVREVAGDDLSGAISGVRAAATAVAGTKGSIDALNTSLGGFQRDLATALENLGTNVSRTIEVRLQERIAGALNEVTKQFGQVATAISATSVAYEGLVEHQNVQFKALETVAKSLDLAAHSASESVVAAGRESKQALENFNKALERAERDAGQAIATEVKGLSSATTDMKLQLTAVSKSVSDASTELSKSLRAMQALETSLRDAADKELEAVKKMGEVTRPYVEQLDGAIKGLEAAAATTRYGVEQVLRQAHDTTRTMREEFAGLRQDLTGGLDRVQRSIENSAETAAIKMGEAGTQLAPLIEQAAEQLQRAGESLGKAERGFSEALGRYQSAIEQALAQLRITVDLSGNSIQQLASAIQKKRRRFFGRRES